MDSKQMKLTMLVNNIQLWLLLSANGTYVSLYVGKLKVLIEIRYDTELMKLSEYIEAYPIKSMLTWVVHILKSSAEYFAISRNTAEDFAGMSKKGYKSWKREMKRTSVDCPFRSHFFRWWFSLIRLNLNKLLPSATLFNNNNLLLLMLLLVQ